MTPEEEARLVDEIARLLATSQLTRDAAIAAVSDVITAAYAAGLDTDPSMPAVVDPAVTRQSLATASTSMSRRVGRIWDAMDTDIIDTITGAIKRGESYDDAMSRLDTLISDKWGKVVPFDNRGNTVRQVDITPDGQMSWSQHKITRPVSFATDAYAENISRTVVHESWSTAHHDQYKSIGLPGYIYRSVRDAATRPTHLALHGTRIRYGTPEDELAQAVMAEYGCRCTPGPWFDDPEYDTPEEVDEAEKIKAAKAARTKVPDDSPEAQYLDSMILPHKSFGEAKDHDELQRMAAIKWNPRIKLADDFPRTDLATMQTSFDAIDRVSKDFPGSTKNIQLIIHDDKGGAFAFCGARGSRDLPQRDPGVLISFCREYYYAENTKRLVSDLKTCTIKGWLASEEIGATAAHEFGHAIEAALAYRAQKSTTDHASHTITAAARAVCGRAATAEEKFHLRRAISEYAMRIPQETIAESVADVYYNGDRAAPLSTEIVKILKNEWNKS